MVELLKERNPGIDNPEAIEAMTPVVEQVAAVYGPQAAVEPEVIEQAFQSVGGAERFGPRSGHRALGARSSRAASRRALPLAARAL